MGNKNKLLNNQELSMFCDQIAMILNAGISPMEGISIMLDEDLRLVAMKLAGNLPLNG